MTSADLAIAGVVWIAFALAWISGYRTGRRDKRRSDPFVNPMTTSSDLLVDRPAPPCSKV